LKEIIHILFLLIGINSYGQLPSFKSNQKDSIYAYYVQIDQKLEINLNGADPSKIEVKITDGFANRLNDSTFNIRYNAPIEETKLKLYYKNFPVDIQNVKSKNMSIEGIKLGDITDKNVKLSQLLSIKKFELLFPKEMPVQLKPELFSCKLTIHKPGNITPFFTNMRNLDIPQNVQQMIAALPKDSKITFEEIRIKTVTNNVLNLDNDIITFTIVE
jgi:hypothetical protein